MNMNYRKCNVYLKSKNKDDDNLERAHCDYCYNQYLKDNPDDDEDMYE